jgi:phosphatidate cytidylyltransferase
LLGTRIITAVILGGAITAAVLLLPLPASAALFGVLWLVGTWEWSKLAQLSGTRSIAYVVLLGAAMVIVLAVASPFVAAVVMAVASIGWLVALFAIVSYPRAYSPAVVAAIGFVVLVPSWVLLIYLLGAEPLGRALAMAVLVIVWAADVGAYAVGRAFGRHKLAPKVSPGKTWEGVTGGALFAAGAGWAAAQLLDLPAGVLIALGVATGLVSVVGDLTVSMFKRNVGLKDSGRLLPGHGGVMDRIDSLTAAVPVFALGLKITGFLV